MKKTVFLFLIGLIFLVLPAQAQINLLHEFAGGSGDGKFPWGDLLLSGSTLYGMTEIGGSNNKGTLFKIDADGNNFSVLYEFGANATDGYYPDGSLIISGSTIYGCAHFGGEFNRGTIFKILTDGSGYTTLHDFSAGPDDGANPSGSLVLSGSTLYGMTPGGGDNFGGTIFRIGTDGGGFALVHDFTGDNPAPRYPEGSLIISGTTLYGMTRLGGNGDHGTIFKVQTDGSNFGLLHTFAGGTEDGGSPYGSLILSGSTLFGMTSRWGDNDYGTIFTLQTDGTGYALLHKFQGGVEDGLRPYGSLTISGANLFGMTYFGGGDGNLGTLFTIRANGGGYELLHKFAGGSEDGASPHGSLIVFDSILYGMTRHGGDADSGVVFSLPLYSISGSVACAGAPLKDVVMNGLPGSPVTDGRGFYSAIIPSGWSGSVTPTLQFYDFSPSSTDYVNIEASQTTDYSTTLDQPLVVVAPSSSVPWEKGRTYAISWQKQGSQNADVKISLYKGFSTLVQRITTKTANDGSFYWLVPKTLVSGSNYFIRVQTIDNSIKDDSDKFSIIVPTIRVTAPTAGAVWVRNTIRTIAWNKTGTQDANVRIQLFKDGVKKLDITPGAPNSGSYDWDIPATLARGLYTVRIRTLDGKVTGTSKAFTIARN